MPINKHSAAITNLVANQPTLQPFHVAHIITPFMFYLWEGHSLCWNLAGSFYILIVFLQQFPDNKYYIFF